VDCAGDNTGYFVNGTKNGNVMVPNYGDTVNFHLNDTTCQSGHPFEIQDQNGFACNSITNNNDVASGVITLETDSFSTPTVLRYQCTNHPPMRGNITIGSTMVPAAAPTNLVVTAQQTTTDLILTWAAGTQNDCVFSSWSVTFASGGSGSVTGCTGLNTQGVVTCNATGLAETTSYSFTVTEICTNTAANSAASAASLIVATPSLVGIVICQGNLVCNCGNAQLCTCQGIGSNAVCNCQNAAKCVCEGGTCNGGNAGQLVCATFGGCNQQCAKSCTGTCTSVISDAFGGNSCSGSFILQASSTLLAALLAFSAW